MSDIFVSYARPDRPMAEALAQLLERQRWSVWWDRDIDFGKPFDQVIEDELERARCVVVLWSRKSAQSHWVRSEARRAAERGVLVPVRIDQQAEIPLEFRARQTVNLCGWRGEKRAETAQFLGQVSQMLRLPVSAVSPLDLREAWRAIVVEAGPMKTQLRVELSWDKHDVVVSYLKDKRTKYFGGTPVHECHEYYLLSRDGVVIDRKMLEPTFRRCANALEFSFTLMDGDEVRQAVLATSIETKGVFLTPFMGLRIWWDTWSCDLSVEGRPLYPSGLVDAYKSMTDAYRQVIGLSSAPLAETVRRIAAGERSEHSLTGLKPAELAIARMTLDLMRKNDPEGKIRITI